MSVCCQASDWPSRRLLLQVLHDHLGPGEGAEVLGSVVGVAFALAAPRAHAHLVQDVLQLDFSAHLWRGEEASDRERRRRDSFPHGW